MMNRNILNPMMWTTGTPPTPTDVGIYRKNNGFFNRPGYISITVDGDNRITISDRNLGASSPYNNGDTLSLSNCGYYYQRGNNYGFPRTGGVTNSSSQVDASGYGAYYEDSTFRIGMNNGDWTNYTNENLWGQNEDENTDMGTMSRTGPLNRAGVYRYNDTFYPYSRYIPTKRDWQRLDSILSALGFAGEYESKLFIPPAGHRLGTTGEIDGAGAGSYIWTSTIEYNSGVLAGGGRAGLYYGNSIRGVYRLFTAQASNKVVIFEDDTLGYIYWFPNAGPTVDGIKYGAISLYDKVNKKGITIMDRNLGATEIYQSGVPLSEANCGKYYQRGNNYGFPGIGSTETLHTSTNTVNVKYYGPIYYNNTFRISHLGWTSVGNTNLWGQSVNTLRARQGLCWEGYHIPTDSEFSSLLTSLATLGINTSNGECMKTYLKMPFAGLRNRSNSVVNVQGERGAYWSSTPVDTDEAYYLRFDSSSLTRAGEGQACGFSIRPFKNEPVVPDSTWTKLY